jgi:hypothetical protein
MNKNNQIISNFPQITTSDTNGNITGLQVANITVSSGANLGNISGVKIGGGANRQVLVTDGAGNLSWTAMANDDANYANFAGTANIANTAKSVALANVSGAGNIANINLSGNVGDYLSGNGSWVVLDKTSIANGESNVTVYADIVTMSSNGVANIMVIDGDRVSVDGTLQVNVNAYVSNFIANGSEVSLGNIANLHIYGGNAGQYLQTDGTGTLQWATVASDGISNGTSNVAIAVADGNVTVGVNGTANIVQIHEGGLALDGYLETTSRVYPESLEVVDVANIIIPGGANGQVLSTDGNGVLSWTATAAQNAIVNGTSNVNISSANGNVAFSVGGTTNTAVFSNAVTTFNTDLVVTGNLDIQGNITYIESNTVNINDKNITLANAAANSVQADGGGFTIAGANATFVYTNSSNSFTSSHSIAAPVFTGIHRGASQDLVVNKSGGALVIGDAVYISGAQGQRIAVAKASNASEGLSAGTIGIIAIGGADNSECYVQYHGVLSGVNTGGLTEGAPVFLGATAGTWTTTEPISPAHLVVIGFIQRAHASQGEIYIDVNNFQELAECSDVLLPANVANISNRAILSFDSANSLWIDGTLDMGTY